MMLEAKSPNPFTVASSPKRDAPWLSLPMSSAQNESSNGSTNPLERPARIKTPARVQGFSGRENQRQGHQQRQTVGSPPAESLC